MGKTKAADCRLDFHVSLQITEDVILTGTELDQQRVPREKPSEIDDIGSSELVRILESKSIRSAKQKSRCYVDTSLFL